MPCPFCKIKLEKAIFYNVDVDYCPQCLGTFFEENELTLAKNEKDKNLAWLDIDLWREKEKFKICPGIRLCPACRVPLYEVRYWQSDVIVDVCNLCKGIWLERAEFKKIIKYLQEKADYEILKNYTKNLISEFWEVFAGPGPFREEVEDFIVILKLLNYKFLTQYPAISGAILVWPK